MPLIPEPLLQEIVARTDFVAVLSRYLTLRPSQGRLLALCPFHNEKTPSFSVRPELGLWHCFGCGAHGNVFKFLMRIENLSFPEAVRELGRRVGIDVDDLSPEERRAQSEKQRLRDVVERAAAHYHQLLLTSPRAEGARAYLARRGVGAEVIERFRLGYAPIGPDYLLEFMAKGGIVAADVIAAGLATDSARAGRPLDLFRDRVTFPISDPHGQAIAMGGRTMGDGQPKYLNSPETRLFAKRSNLYGLYQARAHLREQDAILVEGYMDVVALHQAGFAQAVASLGTALTLEQANLLRRYCTGAVLAYDADNAGQNATEKGIEIFETAALPVKVVVMPAGDDPDSLIRRQGADAFRERLSGAASIVEYRMESLLSRHDVRAPEGKKQFLEAMLPTLRHVRDLVRWDEYLRVIAQACGVREETVRALARSYEPPRPALAPPGRGGTRGGYPPRGTRSGGEASWRGERPVHSPPGLRAADAAAASPAVRKAERDLVRYLLAHPGEMERARAAVPPGELQDPALQAILACLYALPGPCPAVTAGDLVPLLQQEGVHERVSELLTDEKSEPLTPELFAGLLQNFQIRKDKAELKSLRQRVLQANADRATRRHDDPAYVKFQQLEQRLKGST